MQYKWRKCNTLDSLITLAKKMQEKKSKFLIFNFLGKLSWGRKMKNTFFMFFQKKKGKKINLTNFFSFFKKIIRLEIFILFLSDVVFFFKLNCWRSIFKNANIFFNIIFIDTSAFTVGPFATYDISVKWVTARTKMESVFQDRD